MSLMSLFGLSGLLTSISSFSLGFFVLWKSEDRNIAKRWFAFTCSVGIWGIGAIGYGAAKSAEECLVAARLGFLFGVIWIATFFYHFVCTFLKLERRRSILAQYLISALFVPIVPTPWFHNRADFLWNSMYYPRAGLLFYPFFAWWMGLVIYSHILLWRAHRTAPQPQKKQIEYFFFGMAIGFSGGSMAYLPNFGIDIFPWGHFTASLYPLIMSYAILKHRLMDINVVIRKTLIYSFVSAVLIAIYVGSVTLLARLLETPSASPMLIPTQIFKWFISNLKESFAYSCVATALFSAGFSIFVWMKGPQKPINRMWALACLSVGAWGLGLGMMVRAPSWNNAYLWERWVQYPGAILIPICFLHFVTLVIDVPAKTALRIAYSVAILLEIINATGYLVSIKIQAPFNYFALALKSYPIFVIYFFSTVIYAHLLLLKKMLRAEGQLRNQIKYILLGTSIAFCGGTTSFFPVFNIPIFPYGVYAMPLYIVMVSYAIFKHQLMDINVVIQKTLVYSLLSASLAAVYVGTITVLAQVLGGSHGSPSAFSSALAAIFITLLFNPVRVRIQQFVDRYFLRESVNQTVLREITGAFVHEIKTPLANIALPAELTLMDMEDIRKGKPLTHDLNLKIQKRMKYVMDQALLAGLKVEAVREATVAERAAQSTLDLRQVLKSSLKHMEEHLRHPRVKVQFDVPASLGPIRGSARQLEIVFANLIKNAAEAMAELPANKPHEIHIQAALNDGHVQVRVADTGPGIQPEDTERVFRSHYTTKGPGGAGMGLYLCRQIIQTHGGSIKATSARDKGAVFVIELPVDRNGASK